MIRTRDKLNRIETNENFVFDLIQIQVRSVLQLIQMRLAVEPLFRDLAILDAATVELMNCLNCDEVAVRSFFTTPNHSEIQIEVYFGFGNFSSVEKIWFDVKP